MNVKVFSEAQLFVLHWSAATYPDISITLLVAE